MGRTEMSEKDLSAYKDGLADAMICLYNLKGHRAEHHENMHYYKLGYDYGITLFLRLQELDVHEQAVIDNQNERR